MRREELISDLKELERRIAEMQQRYGLEGNEWHVLENVDDVIFNELTKLGD